MQIIHRTISTDIIHRAGYLKKQAKTGAQRLKRVFNIDITQCEVCKKFNVKISASISDPVVIYKILMHLDKLDLPITANTCRAPPVFQSARTSMIDDYTIQRDFDFGA